MSGGRLSTTLPPPPQNLLYFYFTSIRRFTCFSPMRISLYNSYITCRDYVKVSVTMHAGKVVLGKRCLEILSMIAVDFSPSQTRTPRAHCTPMSQLAKAFASVMMGLLATEMFYLTTGWPCPSPVGSKEFQLCSRGSFWEKFLTSKLKDLSDNCGLRMA